MTTSPLQMQHTQMQMGQQQVQSQANQLQGLNSTNMTDAAKEKKLREACEGFESIFIQKMWEQMRATVPQSSFLHGKDEKMWQGMYDQELSKKMASAGGIGLADMMYEQLSRSLLSATRTTASARGDMGSGFVASAAPLLPTQENKPTESAAQASVQPAPAPAKVTATAATTNKAQPIYSGAAEQPQAEESVQVASTPTNAPVTPVQQVASTADEATPPEVEQALAAIRRRQKTATRATINMEPTLGPSQQARELAASRMSPRSVLPASHAVAAPEVTQSNAPATVASPAQTAPPAAGQASEMTQPLQPQFIPPQPVAAPEQVTAPQRAAQPGQGVTQDAPVIPVQLTRPRHTNHTLHNAQAPAAALTAMATNK